MANTPLLEEEENGEIPAMADFLPVQGHRVLAPSDGSTRGICPVPVRHHCRVMLRAIALRAVKLNFDSHFEYRYRFTL